MAKLSWDNTGDRYYETGTKNGVLYIYDNSIEAYSATKSGGYAVGDLVLVNGDVYKCTTAVPSPSGWETDKSKFTLSSAYSKDVSPWNGLTAVTESPSGAEETALYADDIKYLSLRSAEEFGATIEAYTFPDAWEQCDGSAALANGVVIGQQKRATFGLAFKTVVGNDVDGNDKGYKIHLIYGATASPSERAYQTINDSPEAITFSWEVTTTPVNVTSATDTSINFKPCANVIIDSTKADPTKLASLEDKLFGTTSADPYLPTPGEIYDLFNTEG